MAGTERMRPRFPWLALSDAAPQITPLTGQDVRGLRLPWLSRFSAETLQSHLRANPGMSLWVPTTGEYVIAEQWRRRSDITHIMEAHARKGKQALIEATLARAREMGHRLALISDDVWNDNPRLYASLGFANIERIVFFQKDLRAFTLSDIKTPLPQVNLARCSMGDLDLLLALDHDSFPWLWWNNEGEFEEYMRMHGVEVYIARSGSTPIGYVSFTSYGGWAHLDRLAVVSAYQGRKLGAAQLAQAMQQMRAGGAASVALSTQESNTKSHALYLGFGFRQTREHMNFYGVDLKRDA